MVNTSNKLFEGGDSRVRLFIETTGVSHYTCSFEQRPDNSIYIFFPDVERALFMAFEQGNPGQFVLTPITGAESDHVSIHGSGQAHLRLKSATTNGKVSGFTLGGGMEGGVRHLFCGVFARHQIEAKSPAGARKSDRTIKSKGTEDGKPLCLVFFAVPHVPGLKLDIKVEFSKSAKKQLVGGGNFRLKYHQIICIILKPQDLIDYPQETCVMYGNGFWVPILEEDSEGVMRFGMAGPKFEHTNDGQFDNLKISMRFALPDE